jgi:hypothetical protein
MQGEFRGDFTRDTHHAFKHFSRVLMQQGRVHLDADWNEQTAILLRYLQTLAADLIGPHGGPADPVDLDGKPSSFRISLDPSLPNDFIIGAGHYYVHGILCELGSTPVPILSISIEGSSINIAEWCPDGYDFVEGQYVEVSASKPTSPGIPPPVIAKITDISAVGTPTLGAERTLVLAPLGNASLNQFIPPTLPVLRRITTYKTQPDYPLASTETGSPSGLVYLDVWERHITCIEDDTIREVALGGPDTATRAKIVWQVKTDPNFKLCPDKPSWADFLDRHQPRNRGWLKARAKQTSVSTDPCIILPESSYRGVENQLYRIEIHKGNGPADSTFKWSRDNSSREFPIKSLVGPVATLGYLWRDSRSALNVNDWVEIVDDSTALLGKPGVLMQIDSVGDPSSMTVTLKPPLVSSTPQYKEGDQSHPLLRRWNYKGGASTAGQPTLGLDGALNLEEGKWLELEDGTQVNFVSASPDNRYRTGDYWIIPARTATGDVEWPSEKHADGTPVLDGDDNPVPAAIPPHGIEHHYAPLYVFSAAGGGANPDCRKHFKTVVGLTP